jgi:uncharacterized damage-inducible protein DinB
MNHDPSVQAPRDPDPKDTAGTLAHGVATEFRRRLQGEYLPRIRSCTELLGDAGVWQRPAPNCNSVANLLLHLAGNTTQWILATFGANEDRRDRPAEFAAADGLTAQQLVEHLALVVDRACEIVATLTPEELLRTRTVQARYQETGLSAVLHVLEHFSGHAGQIYAWTKQATGLDLKFYDL